MKEANPHMIHGHPFMHKKKWHTGNIDNVHKVWLAEQKQQKELEQLEVLRKQMQEERELGNIQKQQENAGLRTYVPKYQHRAGGQAPSDVNRAIDRDLGVPRPAKEDLVQILPAVRANSLEEYLAKKAVINRQQQEIEQYGCVLEEGSASDVVLILPPLETVHQALPALHVDAIPQSSTVPQAHAAGFTEPSQAAHTAVLTAPAPALALATAVPVTPTQSSSSGEPAKSSDRASMEPAMSSERVKSEDRVVVKREPGAEDSSDSDNEQQVKRERGFMSSSSSSSSSGSSSDSDSDSDSAGDASRKRKRGDDTKKQDELLSKYREQILREELRQALAKRHKSDSKRKHSTKKHKRKHKSKKEHKSKSSKKSKRKKHKS